jgi:hypothetical protein
VPWEGPGRPLVVGMGRWGERKVTFALLETLTHLVTDGSTNRVPTVANYMLSIDVSSFFLTSGRWDRKLL